MNNSIIKYARYVYIDRKRGVITWFESKATAEDFLKWQITGDLYDIELTRESELKAALTAARNVMDSKND